MCGITGWIEWNADISKEHQIIEAMTETLSSRGPDAKGAYFSTHAALGHRRLIVVDPEGGGQPMTRQLGENTYTITYNGELYNTPELRAELEKRGHTFLTRSSDTEALLFAYIEWGPSCLKYLNGIFAFAIWDNQNQSLFLARDRLGVKPLFYIHKGKTFLFGSEPKSLLKHPYVQPEVDSEGLAEIFALGPARSPGHGVYRGMAEVKPGHYMIYDHYGLKMQQYWTLESRPHTDNLEKTAERVCDLLGDTVKRQLVSDVPVCVLLSGGLDSSALTAFASAAFKDAGSGPLHTYSVDYLDNESHFQASHYQPDSDKPWVEYVSSHFGTFHHRILLDQEELAGSLERAVLARDLPGMADVDSSLYLFCREIKKDATVALSGEAADEIFGGYPWFHSEKALNAAAFPWMRSLDERLSLLSPELINKIRPKEYIAARYRETIAEVDRLEDEAPLEARRREMFYLNIKWFMATLLNRKDRMSMGNGLEVRVPFCDHRLVEYVWNIPWEMKAYGGQAKGILRKALSHVLPEKVLKRGKSPYPKTHHPAYMKAVKKRLLNILDEPDSPISELIDITAIRELIISENKYFTHPWFGQLMGDAQFFAYLLEINTWLREYHVKIV